MHRETWLGVLLTTTALLAAAQDPPSPAPTPRPAEAATPASPTDAAPTPRAPAAPAEIHEFEIIEAPGVRSTQDAPAPPDAVESPTGRREVRIIDGDMAIWVDESGDVRELGDVMGQALEFNPEIRAIRAEIQALMARLEQLEMKTATDIARKKVELTGLVEKQNKLKVTNVKSPELRLLDADIAARKIELDYMVGARGDRPFGDRGRVMTITRSDHPVLAPLALRFDGARPPMEEAPENVRKALGDDAPKITVNFDDMELDNVLSLLGEKNGVNVVLDTVVRGVKVTLELRDITFGQALLAIAESNGLAFIARDYGLFVTTQDRVISIPGPSIPEGIPFSPHAGGTPRPTPVGRDERVFKDGEHVFERKVEFHGNDAKPTPAPAPKPAPNR